MEPLHTYLSSSPQVSLDPQQYLVVVLIVALLVADDDAPIFSGRPDALILSLLINQYFLSLLSPWMPGVLLLLPLSLTASEDNQESINKRLLLSQNQCHPHNCFWGRAWKSHFLHCPLFASSLSIVVSFCCFCLFHPRPSAPCCPCRLHQ